jgi:hypothetical protein
MLVLKESKKELLVTVPPAEVTIVEHLPKKKVKFAKSPAEKIVKDKLTR